MRRPTIAPAAKQDIKDIRAYLRRAAGPSVEKLLYGKLKEAVGLIGRHPGIGHLREDFTRSPLRYWLVYSYFIVYRFTSDQVEIVLILHTSRDISELLVDIE